MTSVASLSSIAPSPAPAPAPPSEVELSIARLLDREDLDQAQSSHLFSALVEGRLPDPLMAAAFVALRFKGETADELTGAALALRARPGRSRRPNICSPTAAAPAATSPGRSTSRPPPAWSPPPAGCRWSSTATVRSPPNAARLTCWKRSAPGSTARRNCRGECSTKPAFASCWRRLTTRGSPMRGRSGGRFAYGR